MYHIILEKATSLPDLKCPSCEQELDAYGHNAEDWTEGEGVCPHCWSTLIIDRSVTTHYYPMVKK